MKALAMVELMLFVSLLFAAASSGIFSQLVPSVLRATDQWAPERRHRLLLLFSLSPLALTSAGVVAALLPGLMALAWPALDHCLTHDDHHLHLCFVHLPVHSASFWASLVLALAVAWLTWMACGALFEIGRALRLLANLQRVGTWDEQLGVQVLATEKPVCLLSGVTTPTVLVSEGFLASVTQSELDIALHHERAHLRRGDILWRLVARVATVFLWSKARTELLRAIELSAERSCDEEAALETGSRLQVAETILKVERMLQRVPAQLAPAVASFGSDAVPARVEALLNPPTRAGRLLPWIATLTVLLILILTVNHPIHHFAESLIELLAH